MPIRRPRAFYQIVQEDGDGADTFLDLTDTPSSYTGDGGDCVKVKSDASGLEFATCSGGATTFLGLTDTPSSYSGQGSKIVVVNSGATALEFATQPTAAKWSLIDDLTLTNDTDGQLSFSGITENNYAAFKIKGYVTDSVSNGSATAMFCVESGSTKKSSGDYINENSNSASALQNLVEGSTAADFVLGIFDCDLYGIASGSTLIAMLETYHVKTSTGALGYVGVSGLSQRGFRTGTAATEAIEIGSVVGTGTMSGWFGLYGLSK